MIFPVTWLFGLPSSGKTTLANALKDRLALISTAVVILDGDEIRRGISSDLGFSESDRSENIRRSAEAAKLLADQGQIVICAFITPKEHQRDLVRRILQQRVKLVYLSCPLEVCIRRDVKGLYHKAKCHQITKMTGLQDEFEDAEHSDLVIDTHHTTLANCLSSISRHCYNI